MFELSMSTDKTLMFQLLLRCACTEVRTVQVPMVCEAAGAQEAKKEHGHDRWPKVAKKIFHTLQCHGQYVNRRSLLWAVNHCSRMGRALVSKWRAVVLCMISLEFYSSLSLCHYNSLFWFNIEVKVLISTHKV